MLEHGVVIARHHAIAVLILVLAGCHAAPSVMRYATQGRAAITRAQCGSCHVIPGVAEAIGNVGPPLTGMGRRTMIAGRLPNTPDNLARWLLDPQGVVPGNAMPATGLTPREARDAAAYLQTLQ